MRLYIATSDDVAALDLESGEVETLLEGKGAQCLAIDSDGVLYVGTRGNGLLKHDGGWHDLELPEKDVFSVAVGPDGAVYAGTEPSRLFRHEGESWRELEGLQDIPSKPEWSFPPRPWTSHVRWIAPNPHDPNLILAGIELGGLMRSVDGGETWQDHRPGAQKDVHCLAWHPVAEGRAYQAAGGGAAFSTDWGDTWTPADEGRDRHYVWGLAVDPGDPDVWYVSATTGAGKAHRDSNSEAFIYRKRGDEPWEAVLGPLEAFPYALLHVGSSILAGLGDGSIMRSDDGGASWRPILAAGVPLSEISAMATG